MMGKDMLGSEWRVWVSFQTQQQQTNAVYADRLKCVHNIRTLPELVLMWKTSPIASLRKFFVWEGEDGYRCNWYHMEGEVMRVNSLNYFKAGISPSWEDPQNQNGGRMVFQIDRTQENYEDLYEALVFYFLGEDYKFSDTINGLRFISTKTNTFPKFLYRVEVWTNFNSTQTEKVEDFRTSLFDGFLTFYHIKNLKVSFKDNK